MGARPNANGSGVDAVDPWPSGESSPGVGPGAPPGGSISIQHRMQQRLWSSSRAGLGETGDALVVSRGSTAGASPRRRPELIPRSRATLLKAARGGSARAHSQLLGPSKYPYWSGRWVGLDFWLREPTTRLATHNPTHRKVRLRRRDVGAVVAHQTVRLEPLSRPHPSPSDPRNRHRGSPMTKPKPGLYPSRPHRTAVPADQ